MEIDCDEKLNENEKIVTKDLVLTEEENEKGSLNDKKLEEMVIANQESKNEEATDLTDAELNKDGGTSSSELERGTTSNASCDENCADKSGEISTVDLNSSTEQEENKEDSDILGIDYSEDCENEETEKSSTRKYDEDTDDGDVNSLPDDEVQEEEDEIIESKSLDDDDDDDDRDNPDDLEEEYDDMDEDADNEDDSPEYEDSDNDNDDGPVVLDSSDDENIQTSQNSSRRNVDIAISSDAEDEDDDDYDDDDLMNDAILSAKKVEEKQEDRSDASRKDKVQSIKKPKVVKAQAGYDYRVKVKKRSIKWLNHRMHNVDSTSSDLTCVYRSQRERSESESPKASTPQKSNSGILLSIDIEDSPEKSDLPSSTTSDIKTSETSNREKDSFSNMQQIDNVWDSIKNAENVKQKQQVKTIQDEQNKENLENNDKNLTNPLKLNGDACNTRTEEKIQENEEKIEKVEAMEISTEDEDKTLEQSIVEESVNKTVVQNHEKIDSIDAGSKPCVNDAVSEEVICEKVSNEAVPNEMGESQSSVKISEDNDNIKHTQQIDLKKSPSSKRSRSASLEDANNQDEVHPTKKLRAELESNFPTHDRILAEYIEKTSNNSIDEIQKHINQLIVEIQTLNDMIKAKEIEWNNMLHLKKVKEEICFRLTRKKQVMEIMATKVGEVGTGTGLNEDTANESLLQNCSTKGTKLVASTPNASAVNINFNSSILHNLSNANTILGNPPSATTTSGGTAQSILQNRANMKSSDLAKEKANTQRLHRNILPKPSSSSVAAAFGASPPVSIPISAAVSSAPTTMTATATTSSNAGITTIPLSLPSSLTNNGALGNQQPILNSYLTAATTLQQQLGEMLNGHHNPMLHQQNNTNGGQTLMVGRQGVFKDVKSIIADYRQRHPEVVPRRGRRVKSNPSATDSSSILSNVLKNEGKAGGDLGALLTKFDGNSRPSSNDSSHSMTNLIGANTNNSSLGNLSFKDVLVQFAKMSGQTDRIGGSNVGKLTGTTTGSGAQSAPPPYPEVTLHPVSTSQSNADQTGSLLHGILTKYTRPNATSTTATSTTQTATSQSYSSSFSPTLARLLTAPERITASHNNSNVSNSYQSSLQAVQSAVAGSGLNLSKVVGHNSEITITPVVPSQPFPQTLLQQQLQHQQQQLKEAITRDRVKGENFLNLDAEADDSVDRLVIDEGGDSAGIEEHPRIAPHAIGQEFHENEVPACQGCKKQEAQFVCAGCGNQWYCSRECQVAAWDEHSEVCTG